MTSVLAAVAVFSGIIVTLALLVSLVRRRLLGARPVTLTLNGVRRLEVMSGESLLASLAAADIHLPAACGGKASCGSCRVIVHDAGRELLPLETAHISPEEAAAGVRLACVYRVHENLALQVPEALLGARQWHCTVLRNTYVGTFTKHLTLRLPAGAECRYVAGQYVLIEAPPFTLDLATLAVPDTHAPQWQRLGIHQLRTGTPAATRRAYSLAAAPRDPQLIELVVRLATPPPGTPAGTPAGVVSSFLFAREPGDLVRVSGPFGEFAASASEREMICIGGGAGIAPLRALILEQLARPAPRRLALWYGARTVSELCFRAEFEALAAEQPGFEFHPAVSEVLPGEHWNGPTGLIHNVLRGALAATPDRVTNAEFYLCGPPLMASAVTRMLDELGVTPEQILFDDFHA